ncbi:hypothetical protein BT69DRAFT_1035490 [Atractiella rhizophila]|nr:hypothetical protein BT69DRAFT_1035490 [Atractiella rhizophila]
MQDATSIPLPPSAPPSPSSSTTSLSTPSDPSTIASTSTSLPSPSLSLPTNPLPNSTLRSPSVRFAPLPETPPRKSRTVSLGVSSRAEMLKAQPQPQPPPVPPMPVQVKVQTPPGSVPSLGGRGGYAYAGRGGGGARGGGTFGPGGATYGPGLMGGAWYAPPPNTYGTMADSEEDVVTGRTCLLICGWSPKGAF